MKPLALVAFLGCVSDAAASAVLDDARTAEDSFVIDVPIKEHRRLQSATTCPVPSGAAWSEITSSVYTGLFTISSVPTPSPTALPSASPSSFPSPSASCGRDNFREILTGQLRKNRHRRIS